MDFNNSFPWWISEDDMDFHIVIRSWLLEQPSEVQKSLQSLIDSYFYKGNDQHVDLFVFAQFYF